MVVLPFIFLALLSLARSWDSDCIDCRQNDCFECTSVKPSTYPGKKVVTIGIRDDSESECYNTESISWVCCRGTDMQPGNCHEKSCLGSILDVQTSYCYGGVNGLELVVPSTATSVQVPELMTFVG